MNWKCCFSHSFKQIGRQVESIYSSGNHKLPHTIQTHFLFECSRCGEIYIKTLIGNWAEGNRQGEDDDDNDDPSPTPLCPDDYFEQLEKK